MYYRKSIMMGLIMALAIIFSSAKERDLTMPLPEIPGAKISLQPEAKKIAFDAYVKKMNLQIMADESAQEISVITLGFDVPEFGKKGDMVWEVRICTIAKQLRAILWVHSETAKIYFLIGPWQSKSTEK